MRRLLIIASLVTLPVKAAPEPDPPEIVLMKMAPPLIVNGVTNPPIVQVRMSSFEIQWTRPFLSLLP